MKIIVTLSGGKDSQASLIWAVKKYGKKNIIAVFSDTLWEHELTYKHIQYIIKELDVEYKVVKSKKYNGFIDMTKKKNRFPSRKARFCTVELKMKPMIDYILDEYNSSFILIQGIRADESDERSKMKSQCQFFKYYFQPYGYTKKGKPKYHTYRKKDVLEFVKTNADDIIRPMFDKTGIEVINYIIDNGQKPNPLYKMGFKRVGCFPCIQCNHNEVKQIINRFPERLEFIKNKEKQLNTTFFPPGYIPDRYCSGQSINKKGELVKYPIIEDVIKYITSKTIQIDMFQEKTSCMSFYSQCE